MKTPVLLSRKEIDMILKDMKEWSTKFTDEYLILEEKLNDARKTLEEIEQLKINFLDMGEE